MHNAHPCQAPSDRRWHAAYKYRSTLSKKYLAERAQYFLSESSIRGANCDQEWWTVVKRQRKNDRAAKTGPQQFSSIARGAKETFSRQLCCEFFNLKELKHYCIIS
jgi:hypothetical protein